MQTIHVSDTCIVSVTILTSSVDELVAESCRPPYTTDQSCCQGLETQGQGQGLDVQGRGQGLTPALIHTWFCMCNMKNNTLKTLFS